MVVSVGSEATSRVESIMTNEEGRKCPKSGLSILYVSLFKRIIGFLLMVGGTGGRCI